MRPRRWLAWQRRRYTDTHTHTHMQCGTTDTVGVQCSPMYKPVWELEGAENLGGQRLSTPVSVAGFVFPVPPTSGMLPLAFSAQRDEENT